MKFVFELLGLANIFTDRIEITSAGGLPEGLSKQEFFEGFSIPRNKELMRIFKDLELVKQLGSGIPRILEHYGKEGFSFSDNFLRMTLIAKEVTDEPTVKADDKEGGHITDLVIDAIAELTHRQKEILKLTNAKSRISRSGIGEVILSNESAIQKHLNNLKEAGFLKRKGGTRGYWQINLENK
nr:ATP-binding protein [Subsaximicrobium wynnwilliamsii]